MITRKDRRQGRRHPISRPVKLRCLITGKYMVGQTYNISSSGALLEIDRPSLLINGQRLAVGVAWTRQQALLHEDDMAHATVIRSLGLGRIQHVAVEFDHVYALPAFTPEDLQNTTITGQTYRAAY